MISGGRDEVTVVSRIDPRICPPRLGTGFFLTLKEGQTIEQAVAEAARVNVDFLKNAKVPIYLTKPREPAWYGSSKL